MTTTTATLTDFLLARIAEDEARAGAVPSPVFSSGNTETLTGRARMRFIAKWQPARVLAECAAKRRIVDMHHEYDGLCTHCVDPFNRDHREEWPCATLRALATIYSDHSDYDEEWRP